MQVLTVDEQLLYDQTIQLYFEQYFSAQDASQFNM